MNKYFYVFFLLIVSTISVEAQRKDNGIALKAQAGIMKGEGQILSKMKLGFSSNLGVSYLISNTSFMIDGEAILLDYSTEHYDKQQSFYNRFYGIKIQGGYTLEELIPDFPFFLNFKIGGLAGLEEINKGENEEIHGISLPYPTNNFIYGVVFTPELEILIWKKFTLLISGNQFWNIGSKYSQWAYSADLGIKYYF